MSEDKSGKHRWRDPVVLVPIITAIIAAIPAYILLIRPAIEDLQSLTSEPTPIPNTKPTPSVNPLSVTTDKKSYGFGDHVMVSGSVGKPVKGKTVRIDVYDPTMTVFEPYDSDVPDYVPQTDIQVTPDNEGQFSYRFPTEIFLRQRVNGTYTVEATYGDISNNATFSMR